MQIGTKVGLVYIAGYIVRKVEKQEEAKLCYGEFGDYIAEINHGGLKMTMFVSGLFSLIYYFMKLLVNSAMCKC